MNIKHHHALDKKENQLRASESQFNEQPGYSEVEMKLRGANEDLISENRMLKDKVGTLNREIDTLVRQSSSGPSTAILDALEREKSRLRADLSDRERQIDQFRAQLDDRDGSSN